MTSFYYEPPSVHQDKGFKGDVSAAYAWATQVVEVEVDTDTGAVQHAQGDRRRTTSGAC